MSILRSISIETRDFDVVSKKGFEFGRLRQAQFREQRKPVRWNELYQMISELFPGKFEILGAEVGTFAMIARFLR